MPTCSIPDCTRRCRLPKEGEPVICCKHKVREVSFVICSKCPKLTQHKLGICKNCRDDSHKKTFVAITAEEREHIYARREANATPH